MSKLLIAFLFGGGAFLLLAGIELPVARVTVHVIGEDSSDLSGVDVGVTFLKPEHKPGTWGSADTFCRSGKTDTHGLFVVEERTGSEVHYSAQVTNFYKSSGRFDYK